MQKNNISLVILDTLQFLLSEQAQGYNKFDLQDKVLTRLRKMATSHNVHIVIVIHPRKTEDTQDIQIHSIYGTSKATQ
jgi:predicted ATP-dependent serine protease